MANFYEYSTPELVCPTKITACISGQSFGISPATTPSNLPVIMVYADLMPSSAMWLHH